MQYLDWNRLFKNIDIGCIRLVGFESIERNDISLISILVLTLIYFEWYK